MQLEESLKMQISHSEVWEKWGLSFILLMSSFTEAPSRLKPLSLCETFPMFYLLL